MITAINRFWKIEKKTKLSHLDVHQYFFLLYIIWNSSGLQPIEISTKELAIRLNTSAQNLKKSRERLKEADLISIIPGTTQTPIKYEIIGLESRNESMGTNIPNRGTFIPKGVTNIPKVGTFIPNPEFDLNYCKDDFKPIMLDFLLFRKSIYRDFSSKDKINEAYQRLYKKSGGCAIKARSIVDDVIEKEKSSTIQLKTNKEYDNKL